MHSVSREVMDSLQKYQELLLKWNKVINLIARSTEVEVWDRHILDSLQLLKFLNVDDEVCDLGSGAGLPGVVLSIAGVKNVTLIESDARKMSFLLQAKKLSSNKIELLNTRIESQDRVFEVIVARAFADLDTIFSITKAQKYLLLKGASYQKEIELARMHWDFVCRVHRSSTSDGGVILEVTHVCKNNGGSQSKGWSRKNDHSS